MKQIFQLIGISLLFVALSACDNKEENAPVVANLGLTKNFTNSGCKDKETVRSFRSPKESSQLQEKILWRAIANGFLKVEHFGIKDYCERDDAFSITTSVEGNKLTLIERVEDRPKPRCYCHYDLSFDLGGFELGQTYTLVFKRDKWVLGPISFTYTSDLSGSLLVKK